MSLAHAILGMLRQRPWTGYELKTQCFDGSISHFWPADQAQIYRTLDRMAEDGWVESRLDVQESRPNRKEYSITAAGREELLDWLLRSQPLAPYREPFLVQLFFAGELAPEQIDGLVDEQARLREGRLDGYAEVPLPPLDQLGGDREYLAARLTLELGLAVEKAHLEWLQLVRTTLGTRE